MKKLVKLFCGGLICGITMLSSGCSILSGTEQAHYHGTKEMKNKIAALEKRVETLEKGKVHTPSKAQ